MLCVYMVRVEPSRQMIEKTVSYECTTEETVQGTIAAMSTLTEPVNVPLQYSTIYIFY